jgi:hypothetical protein
MIIQTKHNLGATVFFIQENKVKTGIIKEINSDAITLKNDTSGLEYTEITFYKIKVDGSKKDEISLDEKYVFSSKEELIDSL